MILISGSSQEETYGLGMFGFVSIGTVQKTPTSGQTTRNFLISTNCTYIGIRCNIAASSAATASRSAGRDYDL